MMLAIPILKGRGVWIDGHHMLSRQELEDLGLDTPDIDPHHIDPRTRKEFDPTRYKTYSAYDGLMRELAREIKKNPNLTNDDGEAQMMARKLLNEATKRFNDKKAPGDPHRLPMPYHPDGRPGLNPEYKQSHYSEHFQKHPKRDANGNMVLNVAPGKGAQRVHPAHRLTKVFDRASGKWVLATKSLSNRDNADIGEIIEGDEFHPHFEFEEVLKENGIHRPHRALRGGIINPFVKVEDVSGEGPRFPLTRAHSSEDPTSVLHGGGIHRDSKMHRGLDGNGYHIMRAVASLHPVFFDKGRFQERATNERYNILMEIFADSMGNPTVNPKVLQDLSQTAVGELLAEQFRGFADTSSRDSRPARSRGSGLLTRTNTLLSTLDIPVGQVPVGSPESKRKDWFDLNSEHILLDMAGHGESRRALSKALFASLLAARKGDDMNHPLKREVFSHFTNWPSIHPNEIKDIPLTDDMGAKFRQMPSTTPARAPFAEGPAGGVSPGGEVNAGGPSLVGVAPSIQPITNQGLFRRSER